MSTRSLHLLIVLHISLSLFPQPSTALPRHRQRSLSSEKPNAAYPPTVYFEVTKPINRPKTKPCSYLLLHHDFGYSYDKPPVTANYTPPTDCAAKEFSTIVLELTATCKGRQRDRIFGVWLGGVELLRSCTAELRPSGIVWKVEKDITRYYSLLMSNQTLVVYLGNIVTSTNTGIYHVEISIHFYRSENHRGSRNSGDLMPHLDSNSVPEYGKWADLILPISRSLPLDDGLWFEIENSTDIKTKEFATPFNVYRAVLEVYVSFHEKDEFWYSNLPNDYVATSNLSGIEGNGAFREVVVTLDDDILVGAVWPFTVIYTGGSNPFLWRPITGIGSFDLPTYDIELTPFLGKLLDGRKHKIGLGVTNALNVWYIDANLHLWLDKKSARTTGRIMKYHAPHLHFSLKSHLTGLNGTFVTKAKRSISSTGWVRASHGKITTSFTQDFNYANFMEMEDNGILQIMNQTIDFNTSVSTKMPSSHVHRYLSHKNFPLYMHYTQVQQSSGEIIVTVNATLGFNEDKISDSGFGNSTSSLKNLQNAHGIVVVHRNSDFSGVGSMQQVYMYYSSIEPCYFRNVSSSNYTILSNRISTECRHQLGGD